MTIGNSSPADWTDRYDSVTPPPADQLQSRVCVWLDAHLIAEWTGPSLKADDYACLLASQFPSLRVTRELALDTAVGH
ncbi:hypothetical protein ACWEOO_06820 [Kribbella sp. NPDC004138]